MNAQALKMTFMEFFLDLLVDPVEIREDELESEEDAGWELYVSDEENMNENQSSEMEY
jgi:hypothetical protein